MSTSTCGAGCATKLLTAMAGAVRVRYEAIQRLAKEDADNNAAEQQALKPINDERVKVERDYVDELAKCRSNDPDCPARALVRRNRRLAELGKKAADIAKRYNAVRQGISDARAKARATYVERTLICAKTYWSCLSACSPPLPGTPTAIQVLGAPLERFPDLVFLQRPKKDAGLSYAKEFHEEWGLKIVTIDTLVDIFTHLASPGTSSKRKRIRLVIHANPATVVMAPFPGAKKGMDADFLVALATDDLSLLRYVLLRGVEIASRSELVLDRLDRSSLHFGTLGLDTPSDLDRALLVAIAIRFTMRNAVVRDAVDAFLDAAKAQQSGIWQASLDALMDEIETLVDERRLSSKIGGFDRGLISGAVRAVNEGLRGKIEAARQRLKGCSVDFRGCRAGSGPSKLVEALAQVFGVKRDEVTAPEWYQAFGKFPAQVVSLECEPLPFRLLAKKAQTKAAVKYWAGLLELPQWLVDNSVPRPVPWSKLSPDVRLFKYLDEHTPVLPVFEKSGKGFLAKVIVSYGTTCQPKDPTTAMTTWVRSMWADPPDAAVKAIVERWNRTKKPPTLSLLMEKKKGQGRVFCAADPRFAEHIRTASP